jgi:hypothetical protein
MNLIQIQEHLKDLPTQVIMSYANGQNPEVPPYMALGELNRRKTSEQRKTEPPTQSVKDKLESEVGGRGMPQGMPQGAAQGIAQLPAAQMAQGAPQGMPQGAPQEMPPAPQGMPPGMAAGGVAGLPVRDDMFHYAPGGIVAFAGGELVRGPGGELVPDDDAAGEAEARAGMAAADQSQGPPLIGRGIPSIAPTGVDLQSLTPEAALRLQKMLRGENPPPVVQSKEEIRKSMVTKALAEGDVDKAKMLSQIPGEALIPLMAQLKEQNEASKKQFEENQKRQGLGALGDALIAAGEATRGQKGIGAAFAGFGKSYSASSAEDIKRQQAQQAAVRAQTIEMATLQSKVDDLRSAYANGTVDDQQAAQKAAQEQAKYMEDRGMGAAKDILTQALNQQQAKALERHQLATETQSKAQLEELKRQHEAQRQEWKNASANRAEQLQIARETRPSIEDKAIGKILQTMPSRVKSLEQRQKDLEFGSDEWNQIQDTIDNMYDQAYQTYGLKAPPRIPRPKVPVVQEKPGFFSSLFGGSPAPKTVSFDQLPK